MWAFMPVDQQISASACTIAGTVSGRTRALEICASILKAWKSSDIYSTRKREETDGEEEDDDEQEEEGGEKKKERKAKAKEISHRSVFLSFFFYPLTALTTIWSFCLHSSAIHGFIRKIPHASLFLVLGLCKAQSISWTCFYSMYFISPNLSHLVSLHTHSYTYTHKQHTYAHAYFLAHPRVFRRKSRFEGRG